jgi:hypothetical protein
MTVLHFIFSEKAPHLLQQQGDAIVAFRHAHFRELARPRWAPARAPMPKN